MENTHYDAQMEKRRRVLAMILEDELTKKQRAVIEAYYMQNKKTAQIAQEMGVTRSAVDRTRLRAEKRIAQCFRYCG